MIEAQGLVKRFGATVALAGVDLRAQAGTVLGLLSPNGSGKTTMVKVLTTLLEPDEGRARVAGFDVVKEAAGLRARIGLEGQYPAVDESYPFDVRPRRFQPSERVLAVGGHCVHLGHTSGEPGPRYRVGREHLDAVPTPRQLSGDLTRRQPRTITEQHAHRPILVLGGLPAANIGPETLASAAWIPGSHRL